jgi:hypothetical protein
MSLPDPHVRRLVDDFLHDLLEADEARRVEQHCAACPDCARALAEARQRQALLTALPPVEPSADLVQGTLQRIDRRERRGRAFRRRFAFAAVGSLAASLLLLTGLHAYYARLKPTGLDIAVLGQQQLMPGTHASLRIRVVDRGTGRSALRGVPVRVALLAPDGREQSLAEFSTDDEGGGSPRFELPDWPDGRYQLRIVAQPPDSTTETFTRAVQLKRSWKVMLSSDKPVYQPGQTIHLRALALRRPDLRPVADQPAVFTLIDPKGNVLFKHGRATSAFGISSADCALAQEIQEGPYTVACKVGDTESKLGVEIKRYVLPKFKLEVRPDRPYYAPGQTARVSVQADYFFGKPVGGGKIELKLRGRDAKQTLKTVEGKTDEKGKVELKVTLPRTLAGTETDGGAARVGFEATVTDSAGQKQTVLAPRLVTTRPVRVEAIPEDGSLVRGVPNTVYLLVSRVDGSPVAGANVEVFGDLEGAAGAEAGLFALPAARARTDERGAASFTVTPRAPSVSWTIRVSAKGGEVLARRSDSLTCGQAAGDFLVRPDRAVYRSGNTMTLTALGAGVEPVFVDFIKDGQTLLSQTIEMHDGKGEHAFDIPPELFGTIELLAYRFGEAGLPIRKRRIVYVEPAQELKISATLDRPEYRPGRQANLKLALSDAKGKPVRGAISLAAVDEAVFAVLAQRPGLEQAFYNLEEELLKPVYAIYPWMPGEKETDRRDRALFAATAQNEQGGAVRSSRFQGELAPAGRHTLAASSYPQKQIVTEQLRHQRLHLVRLGWAVFVLAALALGYAALWVYLSTRTVLLLHGVAGLVLVVVIPVGFASFVVLQSAVPGAKLATRDQRPGEAPADRAPQMESGGVMGMDFFTDGPSNKIVFDSSKSMTGKSARPRIRRLFPETLLWKPELITDDQGRLPPVPIHLADSITTWRLSASAVSAGGRLGATQLPMKVFQSFFVEFNLPVALTRGDEVGVPVVVYNYLDRPQSVKLTLGKGDWFTLSGASEQTIELAPNEVRSTRFTLAVRTVGSHKLLVTALAGAVSDAIEREIEVVPDGTKVETVHSGSLDRAVTHTLEVPANAIEGSAKAFLKLYPSTFSSVVEGLDSIFRMPHGCFEQTSSTTYPNVLALQYLRQTKQSAPQVEAKARQYIHLGYQRLVGFEVKGGGFDWFGRPPANRVLTAYGLMEFEDMAAVHDVDANLIRRTRAWLLAQRKADGGWEPEGHALHEDPTGRDAGLARLGASAYIAWAVFADGQSSQEGRATLDYLLSHSPAKITNDHVLALVCHALLSLDATGKEAAEYLQELARRAKRSEDGKYLFWAPPAQARTLFHGGGASGQIETTALAALALLRGKQGTQARPALAWLLTQKDANGTWHSTQATVLALKALLAGTGKPLGDDLARRVELKIGEQVREIVIGADQAEVLKLIDLSKHLQPGKTTLTLDEKSKTAAGYQVVLRYHVPAAKAPDKKEPLSIRITYDRTDLAVGEAVRATARVVNHLKSAAPMVMLDLPVPPGFEPDAAAFAALVKKGSIARYQARPRSVLVYLLSLEPGKPLELKYTLRATMPVRAMAGVARVYEYYDPSKEGSSPARRFTVRPRE